MKLVTEMMQVAETTVFRT